MKLLFIKLGAIGNVVQAAIALHEYRRRWPETHIEWVTSHRVSLLVNSLNVADTVTPMEDDGLYSGSMGSKGRTLMRLALSLARAAKYDRIVTAYADWRYGLLTCLVRTASRSRFHRLADRPTPLQNRSRVYEYWSLLSGQDAQQFDIAAATSAVGRKMSGLPNVSTTYSLPKDFIVIAPAGARNQLRDDGLRRWPIDRYRNVIEHLVARGMSVVLVGGPDDQWASEKLADLSTIDLIGKTNLLDLLSVLRRSSALIGNDSGILHLAALTETAIVGIFGPTPANACIPLGRQKTIALFADNRVSCSPCYDGRNYARCSRNVCMEAISADQAIEALYSAMGKSLYA